MGEIADNKPQQTGSYVHNSWDVLYGHMTWWSHDMVTWCVAGVTRIQGCCNDANSHLHSILLWLCAAEESLQEWRSRLCTAERVSLPGIWSFIYFFKEDLQDLCVDFCASVKISHIVVADCSCRLLINAGVVFIRTELILLHDCTAVC